MDNGARLYCNFEVTSVRREKDSFVVGSADGREVRGRVAVNCAGLGAGKVSALFGDDGLCIGGRRGEYLLLDRADRGFRVPYPLFHAHPQGKGGARFPDGGRQSSAGADGGGGGRRRHADHAGGDRLRHRQGGGNVQGDSLPRRHHLLRRGCAPIPKRTILSSGRAKGRRDCFSARASSLRASPPRPR